jgi:hypothetical protein
MKSTKQQDQDTKDILLKQDNMETKEKIRKAKILR